MNKKHSSLLTTLLITSSFGANALGINGNSTVNKPVAKDDHISTIAGAYTSATGNVGTNDRFGSVFTLNGSWVGQYGAITSFDSAGEFTYFLFPNTNNASLPDSGVGFDRFTYTYTNDKGFTDTAELIIEVKADSVKPVAKDDYNSTIIDTSPTVSGDVSTNDLYGNFYTITGSRSGEYGSITSFSPEGAYTYTLFDNTVDESLPSNGIATDRFEYTYVNAQGETDTAWLTIDIKADQSKMPIAKDDHASAVVGSFTDIIGNVGTNDLYGSISTLEGSWVGQYGLITSFDSAGEYTYELFENTEDENLPETGIATDSFQYTYANEKGDTDTASLVIDITADQSNVPIAKNDYISAVIGSHTIVSGNVSTNDLYGNIFTLDSAWDGRHGVITSFDASGSFTYELYENAFTPGLGVSSDTFTYTIANEKGKTDTGWLIVTVKADQSLTPVARDDYDSVIIKIKPSTDGEVGTNDRYGDSFTLNDSRTGQFGFLSSFSSDGAYTYTLFEGTDQGDLPESGIGTDRFQYTYANEKGYTDTAWLTIDVKSDESKTLQPVAKDDYISTVVNTFTSASGSVSTNDLYGDIYTLDGSWIGQYGAITSFDSDGKYTYELFESTDNASLPAEGVATDRFLYTYANGNGDTDTAWLIIDVQPDKPDALVARDDNATVIPNETILAVGNVTDNDSNGSSALLISPPSTNYGRIVIQPDGNYNYKLYETAPSIIELKAGEVATDAFEYQYLAESGESTTATLTIQIIGNPVDANGDTIFENPDDTIYDNVDVEFNNRSAQATELNSGKNIKGHLYDSSDKDWYFLNSDGNEIINLEVCPKGSSCFGKKSWVLYVFKKSLLTEAMEERVFSFRRWLDDTGSTFDESGSSIITGTATPPDSNHMYLAYRAGFFEGALIGIVDPCFDTLNSVDIGVEDDSPFDPQDYLIAISSPLKGDSGDAGSCGVGSVVLEQPANSALGSDAEGKPKTYSTTEEHVFVFPNSDDQYTIKITRTGLEPLLSDDAAESLASFDSSTGTLTLPEVRVGKKVYEATLTPSRQEQRKANPTLKFTLSDLNALKPKDLVDKFRATYNPENQLIMIPGVIDTNSGKVYSVILQFHAAYNDNQAWIEVIKVKEVVE